MNTDINMGVLTRNRVLIRYERWSWRQRHGATRRWLSVVAVATSDSNAKCSPRMTLVAIHIH
jgi:hypothetical protein